MRSTVHISFEELAGNLANVLNKVREERTAIVVEYRTGENVLIKPLPAVQKASRRVRKRTKVDYAAHKAGGWDVLY